MKPSQKALELLAAVMEVEYSTGCIEGTCEKMKKCNKRGYCVIAARLIQDAFDELLAEEDAVNP